jgi:hypothetical protein
MDCLCGCGTKLSRGVVDFNFQAGDIASELMIWDKARAGLDPDSDDVAAIGRMIEPGAAIYQRSLAILHGEAAPGDLEEGARWLERSRDARREMSQTRPFVPGNRIKPTESDFERFNPLRPETTFSGPDRPLRAAGDPEDPVARLRGLRDLHAAGALTDAEFAAAKARVIGGM